MGRSILAVLAGAALWTVLWLGTTSGLAAAFPDIVVPDQYLGHLSVLLTLPGGERAVFRFGGVRHRDGGLDQDSWSTG